MAIEARSIFLIGLGVIFMSAILPTAMDNFFGANTTTWDAGTVALWTIIPLAIVAALVLKFVPGGSKGE